ARSDERRRAEERLLTDALGQLVREWLARGGHDQLRCPELLIVKGRAKKGAAQSPDLTAQAGTHAKDPNRSRPTDKAPRGRPERGSRTEGQGPKANDGGSRI